MDIEAMLRAAGVTEKDVPPSMLDMLRRADPKRKPDTTLAYDMGKKGFADAKEAIGRVAALCPGPVEGALATMLAVIFLYEGIRSKVEGQRRADPNDIIAKIWDQTCAVVRKAGEEASGA